jgi:hypothetical protein
MRVWAEVARKHALLGARSPTGAMRDAYEERASDLEAMTRSFARPKPEQTGVVVAVGGRAVSFDGFDRPETLTRLWPRLVRGYAMEALGEPERQTERETAERFVAAIGSAKATAHDAVGLGTEVVLTAPGTVAGALVWEGSVVHVAAFADASERSGEGPSDHVAGRSWFRDRVRTVRDPSGSGWTERPFVSPRIGWREPLG